MGESALADLFALPLTFLIASSLAASHWYFICVLGRDHNCLYQVSVLEVLGQHEFPQRNLGPLQYKFPVPVQRACLARVVLYLLKAGVVRPGCRWGLEPTYTALQVRGTASGSSAQKLKAHFPAALAQFANPMGACPIFADEPRTGRCQHSFGEAYLRVFHEVVL
jgi:hypothetical protein